MPTTAEQEIYSRLTSAPTFHPANAILFQRDWTIEPGDVVTVKSGSDSYSVPVYALKLNWMGSDQAASANADRIKASIESTGNEKREPLPELRRKEYQTARSSYGYYRAQQQEIDEHYRHLTETTDRGMAEAFGIIGVKLGPDGMPLKDANGNYIWDDSGTGGEIWGHLNRDAWSTQIMHHIKDENGNILSLAEVYTDAYGNAIINAINNDNTGTATIKANRIKLITTHTGSGGETVYHGLAIDTDGSMYFDATGAVFEINASTATINASHIKLNATDTITLNALLGIEANTQQLRVIGDLYVDNTVWATDISALSSIHSDITIDAPTIEGGYGRFQNLYCKSTFDQYGELTGGEDVSAAFKDMQFIVDPQNSGHFILQGKTLANPNTWVNVTNFNIAATQFFQDSVAARTAHSISRIDLGSGDTGQSLQTVTVYSTDDHEEDVSVTVDASAVYTAGQNAVQQSGSIAINTNNPPTYYGSTTPPSISCSVIGTLTNGNSIGGTVLISGGAVQDAYDDGYADCHLSYEWGTGVNANRLIIGKTTSGSANSLSFDVTAGASISYDSTTHKYTATGKAYVDSAQKDSDTADSGTEAYIDGWGAARASVGNFPESTPQTLTGSITFKKPSATVDGTADEYPYTLDVDNSYVYLKYGINPVARISNPAFANGKSAHTATSAGTVTLTSSDTGSSVSNTTVTYSNGDTTASVPITIDASAVYGQGVSDGQGSVSARIRSSGGNVVSGTLSLTSGQHITLYPSKKIGSSYTDITDYGVEVIAPTDSGSSVTLINDDTSITAITASTDQIHFLGRRDNADSRTQIDVEVGVTLSNGKRYSRWITQINTGMTFAGRQNMYVYDSVDDTYVAIGVHDWFYKN